MAEARHRQSRTKRLTGWRREENAKERLYVPRPIVRFPNLYNILFLYTITKYLPGEMFLTAFRFGRMKCVPRLVHAATRFSTLAAPNTLETVPFYVPRLADGRAGRLVTAT